MLLVVAVAFFSFGALSHTQGQAAASSNDIVPGGFTSASNFISKLRANSPNDLQTIYASKYNLPTSEYDRFVKEAKKAELIGLKGHRSVGGLRASIYNAVPLDSVKALVDFMAEFQKKNG